jgi:glycosyltransferase involved in cell wall biosynthesis
MLVLLEPVLIILDTLLLLLKATVMVLRTRPSFVFVLNAPDTGPVVVRMATSLTRTPYVYACRDPAPLLYPQILRQYSPGLADFATLPLSMMEGLAAKGARSVVTVGGSMSRYFGSRHGLSNCVAIYGSVPLVEERIASRQGDGRDLTLVLAGTVGNKVFDLDLLLSAMSLCEAEGHRVKLKVIGSVEPEARAKLSSLGGNVDIQSWSPWDEYMSVLKTECDAGVIPLRPTEFADLVTPNKLFDFMAAGLPVIGPRLPGIVEVVQDRSNGSLYEPGSAESLHDSILSMSDAATRVRLGENSRRLFESKYNEAVQMDRFRAMLAPLVS